MYAAAAAQLPPRIRSLISSANVENVVKPPHIPVFKSSTMRGLMSAFLAAAAAMSPMANAPATFITSVFTGKPFDGESGMSPIR